MAMVEVRRDLHTSAPKRDAALLALEACETALETYAARVYPEEDEGGEPDATNQDRVGGSARLLPLAKDPFQAPTDRDMLPSERRLFVQTHRTCVFGYGRVSDGPAMSIVYYVPDDNDDLLVATMSGRAKAKAVARNGKVSLCILDEIWPFAYLQVYCDAVSDDNEETLVDVMMAVAERMCPGTRRTLRAKGDVPAHDP